MSTAKLGKGLAAALAALAVLLCLALSPALALDFPALSGRVVDQAGILDASTRTSLDTKLAELEARTTDQLVVVTLKSLQGTTIEDFGVQLGRHWGVGQKGKNNGVLLIVAPNERKVRIEVGYGLEGTLTDALARFIIENAIIPRFRAGDFSGGIVRGVDDTIQVLSGEGEELRQLAETRTSHGRDDPMPTWMLLLIVGVVALFTVPSLLLSFRRLLRQLRDARRHGRSAWSVLAAAAASGSSGSSSSGFSGGGGSFGGGGSSGSW